MPSAVLTPGELQTLEKEISELEDTLSDADLYNRDPQTFDTASKRLVAAKDEIDAAEKDPARKLKLKFNPAAVGEEKRRGPRYTPLSKRQDRPNSILWLVKFHPELSDGQIAKLVGTTKPTIQSIRERTHWNIANMQPIDPVALGLCKQSELDAAVQKAAAKAARDGVAISDDERRKLVSTETSLGMDTEPRIPSSISGLETFSLSDNDNDEHGKGDLLDADSFFNLPAGGDDEDDDEQP
mgnify:CR=1 FL=1